MKFFKDKSDLWVASDTGLAMILSDANVWVPEGGSRPMALEVFGDERATELSAADAAAALASLGAPVPSFAAKDGSSPSAAAP